MASSIRNEAEPDSITLGSPEFWLISEPGQQEPEKVLGLGFELKE